ncbi:MAG TPA: hypothetical protein VIU11_14255 [Nakamurella sp.]
MSVDPRAPGRAPVRPDLTWLRHRSRSTAAGSTRSIGANRPRGTAAANSVLADFVAGRSTARRPAGPTRVERSPAPPRTAVPPAPPRVTRPAASLLDLSAPAPAPAPPPPARQPTGSSSLDLAAPSVPPASSGSLELFGSSAPPAPSDSLDLSAPPPARRPPGSSSLDLSGPSGAPTPPTASTSLDLGGPTTPPTPAARPTGSTSLDLGAAPVHRPPAGSSAGGSTSLDLSAAPTRPTAAVPPVAPPMRRPPSTWREARTTHGVPTTLNQRRPTVTLTRVQSGVGTLTFEAVVTAAAGDLRLGCAYQLRSGQASVVAHHAGRRYAPPGETRRPVFVANRQQYERIAVDLRQVSDLERFVVYAFSGNGQPLQWGGTLIATTFGGDRIELPIDMAPAPAVAVLASVYNIRGELVIRSEMDLVGATIREACRAYGFDRISWVDDSTPID